MHLVSYSPIENNLLCAMGWGEPHTSCQMTITCAQEVQHAAILAGVLQCSGEARLILIRVCTEVQLPMQKEAGNHPPVGFFLSTIFVLLIVLEEAGCILSYQHILKCRDTVQILYCTRKGQPFLF